MSNRKKCKTTGRYPYLILTEHNKKEVAEFLSYPVQDCDLYLLSAKAQGYKGVRIGPFSEEVLKDPRFIAVQELEAPDDEVLEAQEEV